jgi:hypothetical protein
LAEGINSLAGGIMIRAQPNATSSFVAHLWDVNKGHFVVARRTIGGPAETVATLGIEVDLRLVRRGNTIYAYKGPGDTGPDFIAAIPLQGLGAAASYGMFVANGSTTGTASGVFRNVKVGPLPGKFEAANIGSVSPAGTDAYDYGTGTFSFTAGGAGLKGTSDNFHFGYRTMIGDGSLIARIQPPGGPDGTKGGVMLRGSLAANAPHVTLSMDSSDRLLLTSRASAGATTPADTVYGASSYDGWVEIIRSGNTISTRVYDGVSTWRSFQTRTLTGLGSTVYVGFATASGLSGTAATSSFDTVYFQPVDWNQ